MRRTTGALVIGVFAVLILTVYFGTDLNSAEPSIHKSLAGMTGSFPRPTTTAGWALAVATLSMASLVALFSQLGETKRRFRSDIAPYLRVDLAPEGLRGTWTPYDPPETDLTWEDLNPRTPREQSPLDRWTGAVPIYLWVKSTQESVGGIADNVKVAFDLTFPDHDEPDIEWRNTREVSFSYLEPDHLNRYEVARFDPSIPYLIGEVTEIRYGTIFGRFSAWAHGSTRFEWSSGRLINDRRAYRQREGVVGRQRERLLYARERVVSWFREQRDDTAE